MRLHGVYSIDVGSHQHSISEETRPAASRMCLSDGDTAVDRYDDVVQQTAAQQQQWVAPL